MIIASKRMGKGDFRSDKNRTGAYLGRDLEIVKFYCFDVSFFSGDADEKRYDWSMGRVARCSNCGT